jgi:hypothetical protein
MIVLDEVVTKFHLTKVLYTLFFLIFVWLLQIINHPSIWFLMVIHMTY